MKPTVNLREVCGLLRLPMETGRQLQASGTMPVSPFKVGETHLYPTSKVLKHIELAELPIPIPDPPIRLSRADEIDLSDHGFWLYRMFNTDGDLLYVGQSVDPISRWKQHAREKSWIGEVAIFAREPFDDAESLNAAEVYAIKSEHPKYNISYNN